MNSESSPCPSKPIRVFIRFLFLSLVVSIPSSAFVKAETYKTIHVSDGHTIQIFKNGQKQFIRHFGVETPEKFLKKNEHRQIYSQKNTNLLAGMVPDKDVSTESYGADRYGRVLGVVYLGRSIVNLELVRK